MILSFKQLFNCCFAGSKKSEIHSENCTQTRESIPHLYSLHSGRPHSIFTGWKPSRQWNIPMHYHYNQSLDNEKCVFYGSELLFLWPICSFLSLCVFICILLPLKCLHSDFLTLVFFFFTISHISSWQYFSQYNNPIAPHCWSSKVQLCLNFDLWLCFVFCSSIVDKVFFLNPTTEAKERKSAAWRSDQCNLWHSC